MELFVQSHSESIQFVERVGLMHKAETVTQQAAAWHLDRVDQRSSILDGVYTYSQNGSGEWSIECSLAVSVFGVVTWRQDAILANPHPEMAILQHLPLRTPHASCVIDGPRYTDPRLTRRIPLTRSQQASTSTWSIPVFASRTASSPLQTARGSVHITPKRFWTATRTAMGMVPTWRESPPASRLV